MRCKVVVVTAAMLLAAATAHATQIQINGVTTFFDNYENATSVAAGAIPTATYSTSVLPNAPQTGSWYSFAGTLAGDPAFVQNVQVTNNAAGGTSGTPDFSPGPYSGNGGTNYLRAFRAPTVFTGNPAENIVQGPIGTPTATIAGDQYYFETMISAQVTRTSGTSTFSLPVFSLVDSTLQIPGDPLSGLDMITISFRHDGAILANSSAVAGMTWNTDGSWEKLAIDYTDGAGTFTLSYGDQVSSPINISSGTNGHALRTAIGRGNSSSALNGGVGSRVFYDSVTAVPEPGAIFLMGFGIIGACIWRKCHAK